MAATATVTDLLNRTLDAVSNVLPMENNRTSGPALIQDAFVQSEMGVLIGITGPCPGRLILNAHVNTFANVAKAMYGMALEGDLLESFVGEIGNMVAGNAISELSKNGVVLNITPPTVMVGHTKLTGFQQGIEIHLDLSDAGELKVLLIIDDQQ